MKELTKTFIEYEYETCVICFFAGRQPAIVQQPEWFENDQPEIDFFAVPEDATGEEAELRRNFFNERGVYLLFNDTLGIRQTPTLSGDTMTNLQVIDFLWDMTPSDQYRDSIKFVYQNDEAQRRAATSFLQEEVFKELPELFYPYSVLLVEEIWRYPNTGYVSQWQTMLTLHALQCSAIAINHVNEMTDAEKDELIMNIVGDFVISRINLIPEEDFEEFYSFSKNYYDLNGYEMGQLGGTAETCGFLEVEQWLAITKEDDKMAFLNKVFELSEEEFRTTYDAYPLIISKMEALVKLLNNYEVNIYR